LVLGGGTGGVRGGTYQTIVAVGTVSGGAAGEKGGKYHWKQEAASGGDVCKVHAKDLGGSGILVFR
jgi:hypothetical protein